MIPPSNRDKSNVHPLVRRGLEYHERGEYSKAIHQLKKVLLEDPFSEEALTWVEHSMKSLTSLEAEILATIKTVAQPGSLKEKPKQVPSIPVKPIRSAETMTKTVRSRDDASAYMGKSGKKITEQLDINQIVDKAISPRKSPGQPTSESTGKPLEQIVVRDELFDRGFQAYRQGKYCFAYDQFELLLKQKPGHKEGQRYRKITQEILKKQFTEKLGSPKKIPVLLQVDPQKLKSLSFTPDEGFLMSRVDGVTPFKHIFYQSQLNTFDTCRFFVKLLDMGLIKLK